MATVRSWPGRIVPPAVILQRWFWGWMGSTMAGLVLGMVYLPRTWILLVAKSCLMALSLRKTLPPMQLVWSVLTTTALNWTD